MRSAATRTILSTVSSQFTITAQRPQEVIRGVTQEGIEEPRQLLERVQPEERLQLMIHGMSGATTDTGTHGANGEAVPTCCHWVHKTASQIQVPSCTFEVIIGGRCVDIGWPERRHCRCQPSLELLCTLLSDVANQPMRSQACAHSVLHRKPSAGMEPMWKPCPQCCHWVHKAASQIQDLSCTFDVICSFITEVS